PSSTVVPTFQQAHPLLLPRIKSQRAAFAVKFHQKTTSAPPQSSYTVYNTAQFKSLAIGSRL
ncbi:unnamed protein product, partial [Tilletia caries]